MSSIKKAQIAFCQRRAISKAMRIAKIAPNHHIEQERARRQKKSAQRDGNPN